MAKALKKIYKNFLPWPLQKFLHRARYLFRISKELLKAPLYYLPYVEKNISLLNGRFSRDCPICGYSGFFRAFGFPPRYDAQCPSCNSLERHRLIYLHYIQSGELTNMDSILHFAPEREISEILKHHVPQYNTADISGQSVDYNLDIENIDLPSESYDAVIANHVLEHVDDTKALSEIKRILKPDGVFYCMIPIIEGWEKTYENPNIKDQVGRELHFGQHDHVRYFGRDFRERVKRAGFTIHEKTAFGQEVVQYGLLRGEKVFACRKNND